MTTRSMVSMVKPADDEQVGSTGLLLQGTYRLGALIGEGGMGEVYEATHVRMLGRVAVKILRPHLLANEEAFTRFCREAEMMSTLRHPHIVHIFDFNTTVDGMPYFVMEYLNGVDLATRLTKSGALPLATVVRFVDAVAAALTAAHAVGIVHRDLKPANIFLMRGEGEDNDFVKVIDFGISQNADSGPHGAAEAEVMGTPEFMAPEQAFGLATDERTDQFALAAITYSMLTGRAPFVGDDAADVLYRVAHAQPPQLSSFLSQDTARLQPVLDRGLAKHKKDRYDSVGAFAAALSAAARLLARPTPPVVTPALPSLVSPSTARIPILWRAPRVPTPLPPAPAANLPPKLDRVPREPRRALALGLVVLGLAALVVYRGWYRGLPARMATLEHYIVSMSRGGEQTPAPALSPARPAATPVVTAPPAVTPPLDEPPSEMAAANDEAPPVAQETSRRPAPAPARRANHRRRAPARSGWQGIELPYRAPSSPQEAADATLPPSQAPPPFSAPPELLPFPEGF